MYATTEVLLSRLSLKTSTVSEWGLRHVALTPLTVYHANLKYCLNPIDMEIMRLNSVL